MPRNLLRGGLFRNAGRHLMEEGGETVNLALEEDGLAVYLAQVECRQVTRLRPARHTRAAALLGRG